MLFRRELDLRICSIVGRMIMFDCGTYDYVRLWDCWIMFDSENWIMFYYGMWTYFYSGIDCWIMFYGGDVVLCAIVRLLDYVR